MKIRRKLPKPSRSARPAYLIGYPSVPPTLSDLRDWFDLEYGGPLNVRHGAGDGAPSDDHSALVLATHGPWSGAFQLSLPVEEAGAWRERLSWGHTAAGQVIPTNATPREASNQVLHAARLARGLTLLTDGTAYDTTCHTFLNPSDWKDRSLDQFKMGDHLIVEQTEADESSREWFSTRGLAKFGLDEIETFRPIGLPNRPVIEILSGIADELARIGQTPKVGTALAIPALGLSVQIIRHRTVGLGAAPTSFREVAW